MKCRIFDIDVSQLTAEQLRDRCSGCLEHTGGEQCNHLENNDMQFSFDFNKETIIYDGGRQSIRAQYTSIIKMIREGKIKVECDKDELIKEIEKFLNNEHPPMDDKNRND